MVVKDIYSQGAQLPEPDELAKSIQGQPLDAMSKVQKAVTDGAAIRGFMEASGMGVSHQQQQQSPQKAEEKFGMTLDVAKLMESQSTITNTLLTQLTGLMAHNMSAGQNAQLQEVQRGLQDIREAMRGGPPVDPVQSLVDNQEKLVRLMDVMKSTAGVPQVPFSPSSATDFATVLELTKLQMAQQEAQRRWEEERLDRQHHYDAERQKWNQEFQIRLLELQDSRSRKDQATDMFSNIATAIASGIDARGQAAAQPQLPRRDVRVTSPGPQVEAPAPAPVPKTFSCEVCGEVVQVQSPDATGAVCQQCGSEFNFQAGADGDS